jgi:hypothetical protein
VIESDGKTENAQHVLALDQERQDFGPEYHGHGVLFCWPDGRPPHPRHDYTAVQKARRGGRATRDRPARRATQLRHRWPGRQDRLEGAQQAHRTYGRDVHHRFTESVCDQRLTALRGASAGRLAGRAVDGFQVSIVATFCTIGGGPAVGSAP